VGELSGSGEVWRRIAEFGGDSGRLWAILAAGLKSGHGSLSGSNARLVEPGRP